MTSTTSNVSTRQDTYWWQGSVMEVKGRPRPRSQSATASRSSDRSSRNRAVGRCDSFEMPDWTKKNFDELRDVSPQDAQMRWRFAREALGSPELGVSRFTYDPGARMPWGHRHRVQEEAYVVVAGSGRAKLDDEVVELSVWDVLRVAPAVVRSFEAGPEGLDVICIGGRKPKGGDTERFEDFWD
jgi:mannose-6-phosphate isomerase-like protein (cupin superfamily)